MNMQVNADPGLTSTGLTGPGVTGPSVPGPGNSREAVR